MVADLERLAQIGFPGARELPAADRAPYFISICNLGFQLHQPVIIVRDGRQIADVSLINRISRAGLQGNDDRFDILPQGVVHGVDGQIERTSRHRDDGRNDSEIGPLGRRASHRQIDRQPP